MVVVGADGWKAAAMLGRRSADGIPHLSRGRSASHWLEWEFGGSPVEQIRSPIATGMRVGIRLGSQTDRFRSRWHAEVATTGLPADERAQARSPIVDQHCLPGHARTRGRPE